MCSTFSKIYSALGLENTLSSHTSRTCGSAPTSQATKDYFTSLGLFLSDVYGCTEATGPQTTCLELRKFICTLIELSKGYLNCTKHRDFLCSNQFFVL